MASRKTGLQVTPRSPSGSALATYRLIAKSCLNNRIRYSAAADEHMQFIAANVDRVRSYFQDPFVKYAA
ncbi:MAG: hypothetical protein VB124_00745 [Burkholderia sp.]